MKDLMWVTDYMLYMQAIGPPYCCDGLLLIAKLGKKMQWPALESVGQGFFFNTVDD